MSAIQVRGIQSLKGEIQIQGAKNAVLPMMAAAVLNKGVTVITNVPGIRDVFCMMNILEHIGCKCRLCDNELVIDAVCITSLDIPKHYVTSMRSSIMLLGALLGRVGEAHTYYPGGCSIGERPLDLHFHALSTLGVELTLDQDEIWAKTSGLTGGEITLDFPSVGATENGILASVTAKGTTVIRGCAREPEIEELCLFLNCMGAEIRGIGTSTLTICGKECLHDVCYRAPGDRIVAGTYLMAALACTGDICLKGVIPSHLACVLENARYVGAEITVREDRIRVRMDQRPRACRIKTGPYPEFPTDLQSPMMAVMAVADGESRLEENVFEGRFETAKELMRLGADIAVEERMAYISGKKGLLGNLVTARDLRGGAALVVAGLAAEGVTTINDCFHISRGYESIDRDLSCLGAWAIYHKDSQIGG